MLRGLIGTEAFWRGIQDYYRLYRNGNASTADFRRAMERAGGRDLQWFFDQWLRRGGIPQIEGTWQYDAGRGAVRIDLHQTQPGAPFRLPMEIGLSSEGQPMQRQRVEITERDQRLTIALAAPPTAVTLDPDTWVLMESALDPR
jgi:aminopeptidase N